MTSETYRPCAFGIHVCGVSRSGEEPVTIANFRTMGTISAKTLFEGAKEQFASAAGEPNDLIVDLCLGANEIPEGFPMTRQMLDRLRTYAATCGAAEQKMES